MKRTRQERLRLGALMIGIALFFAVVVVRLAQFQIVWAAPYSEVVERQSSGKIPIPAERGMVYDRHGNLVAKNVTRASLYAHPDSKTEMNKDADYLGKVFGLSRSQAIKQFRLQPKRFRWIKRRLDDKLANRIADEAPRGLYLRNETSREYPFGQVGKQILGFTNIDNEGLSGFELACDSALSGKSGWADIRRDGLRHTFRVKEAALVKPVPGQSVVLTVDWQLQEVVQDELRTAVEKYNAQSGMAVFVDCNSGDILAMAHYDPDEKHPNRPVKLCAVTDQFEPGSSFKPFTAAALLDAGMIDFQDSIYCEMGKWKVGRRTLHDDKEKGWLSFRKVIELSSNIGLGKCVIQMDANAVMDTYRKFGFGQKLGCGLPGETSGHLAKPAVWSDYNVAALAMGHSVAVNALQMATAMAAIANGGELLQPQLVLGNVEDNGCVKRTARREVLGRALKASSADSLRAFLRGVVEEGTATPVNSEFVKISGKTGTGQIPNLETGGYYRHRFTASFCGFFPSDKPLIAGIVVLKNPKPITYGGYTSGVAFRKIAERYTVSNPDLFEVADRTFAENTKRLDITAKTPDMIGRDLIQAKMLAEKRGVKIRCSAKEGTVVWQFPAPDRLIMCDDEVVVAVAPPGEEQTGMIDLKGLTVRKAAAFLEHVGLEYEIEGTGRIKKQSIRPGETITEGQTCRLTCRPS